MAKEVAEGKEYDFKSDIYMLGLTFYSIMVGTLPEVKKESDEDDNFVVLKKKNSWDIIPENYSQDIKHFIQKLLTVNKDERPSAKKAFALAISYYTLKYLKITSILATLECFLAIPSIGPYFKSEKIKNRIKNDENERKYVVTKIIKEALDYADPNNFDYDKLKIQCYKIRTVFYVKNSELNKSLEIDSFSIIEDICNKLHRELNKAKLTDSQNSSSKKNNSINEDYRDENGEKIDEDDEQKVISCAVKKFGENFISRISDQLLYFNKYFPIKNYIINIINIRINFLNKHFIKNYNIFFDENYLSMS